MLRCEFLKTGPRERHAYVVRRDILHTNPCVERKLAAECPRSHPFVCRNSECSRLLNIGEKSRRRTHDEFIVFDAIRTAHLRALIAPKIEGIEVNGPRAIHTPQVVKIADGGDLSAHLFQINSSRHLIAGENEREVPCRGHRGVRPIDSPQIEHTAKRNRLLGIQFIHHVAQVLRQSAAKESIGNHVGSVQFVDSKSPFACRGRVGKSVRAQLRVIVAGGERMDVDVSKLIRVIREPRLDVVERIRERLHQQSRLVDAGVGQLDIWFTARNPIDLRCDVQFAIGGREVIPQPLQRLRKRPFQLSVERRSRGDNFEPQRAGVLSRSLYERPTAPNLCWPMLGLQVLKRPRLRFGRVGHRSGQVAQAIRKMSILNGAVVDRCMDLDLKPAVKAWRAENVVFRVDQTFQLECFQRGFQMRQLPASIHKQMVERQLLHSNGKPRFGCRPGVLDESGQLRGSPTDQSLEAHFQVARAHLLNRALHALHGIRKLDVTGGTSLCRQNETGRSPSCITVVRQAAAQIAATPRPHLVVILPPTAGQAIPKPLVEGEIPDTDIQSTCRCVSGTHQASVQCDLRASIVRGQFPNLDLLVIAVDRSTNIMKRKGQRRIGNLAGSNVRNQFEIRLDRWLRSRCAETQVQIAIDSETGLSSRGPPRPL